MGMFQTNGDGMAEANAKDTRPQESKKTAARGTHIYHNVFEELQQRIRRGDWLPGERMPSIAQLARDLQVGAGSLREALRSLQSIGLVTIEHGSGVYVTGKRPATEISSHFQNASADLVIALAETRWILEPELVALAAERATNEELAEIEDLARQMEEAYRHGCNFAELDVQFHRQIACCARNPILCQTMEGVSDLFLESRRNIILDPEAMLRALRYHALIADMLKQRNASQARLLMQGHMNSMLSEVLASEEAKRSEKTNKNVSIQLTS
jgi:GntR family transcriptional repressor for pyruvate dehydrogenase complex